MTAAKKDPAQGPGARKTWDPDSLTDLALSVFLDRGYSETSMEDLARAAGTHKSNFYHHFPGGKRELLRRGLNRGLDALTGVFEEPGALEGPAAGRLRYVLRRAIEVEFDLLPEVALLLRVRGNSEVELAALERRRELTRRLTGIVEAAMEEGGIRPDLDAHLIARLLLGVETSMTDWLRRDGRLDADTIARSMLSMVFEGLNPQVRADQ
ncbi:MULTISPECIES: TetR/AcrR family transcriptional regulator [unclassified Streptomyces]|uniref:TetR/AcrR family transcriptional regulator n=1 Tax=unclassified Streptomyces TaxID=2593676 RepID=UPI0035DC3666